MSHFVSIIILTETLLSVTRLEEALGAYATTTVALAVGYCAILVVAAQVTEERCDHPDGRWGGSVSGCYTLKL